MISESTSLSGHRSQHVLEIIRSRAKKRDRQDGKRLALVVEGGSMRGVYTAGSLLALHLMGMSESFDNAYGTSAGAVNTAHFLSGSGNIKADTYYRFLADGRFYNPRRVSKIVDIDFFVDEVLTELRPVELDRVSASPTALWISVADFTTARSLLFHAQAAGLPLLDLLKATTAMPVLYNKLITLGEVRGFDAGFVNPFPLNEAIDHGNTDILVMLATPADYLTPDISQREQTIINSRFARGNESISAMYGSSVVACNSLRDLAHGRTEPPAGVSIATVAPLEARVGLTTQDRNLLRAELINTARGTLRLFDHSEETLDEWIATSEFQ
jgi:predicted patatin/cPLA2 family phospholipase